MASAPGRFTLLLALLLVAPITLAYERVPVPPLDESFKAPALQDLRNRLLAAVTARNTEAVVRLAAEDIHLSFGGDTGHEDLRRFLEDEDYWHELEQALRMGGVYYGGEAPSFWAPFVWGARDVEAAGMDPFDTYVVIGREVQLRAKPARDATALAELGYEAVLSLRDEQGYPASDQGGEWMRIELADGRQGWIAATYLYPLVGLRLSFEKRQGRWVWTRALAGD